MPCPCPHLPALTQPDHSCSASAAWAATRLCTGNFTANPTFSSCLRAKATTMRALAGSSTRSSGPTRRWTPAARQPEASLTSTPSVEGLEPGGGKGGKETGPGLGWEGMRPSCSGRGLGAGLCFRIPSFSQWVGIWEPGLGVAHHPTSCFFQPTPPHPTAPREAPKPSFPI